MSAFKLVRGGSIAAVALGAVLLGGCSKQGGTTEVLENGTRGLAADEGLCLDSCAIPCTSDSECDTSDGELCCDWGFGEKDCAPATICPVLCEADEDCRLDEGEGCFQFDLNFPSICTQPENAVHECDGDADCQETEVCCGIYDEPMCLPASECPHTCSESSECDTVSGEICCTTIGQVEPRVEAGLCLHPDFSECPRLCDTSNDCDTQLGEICCNGTCATSCVETCKESSDCRGQVCCKSSLVREPPLTKVFAKTPGCTGAQTRICADCENGGCDCQSVPGCVAGDVVEGGSCIGTPQACINFDNDVASCAAQAGCEYGSATGYCDGTATECAGLEGASCTGHAGCFWDGVSYTSCTGTPTPCEELSYSECASGLVFGCHTDDMLVDLIPMGSECCNSTNPCDWANDGFCDCDGTQAWDSNDCL